MVTLSREVLAVIPSGAARRAAQSRDLSCRDDGGSYPVCALSCWIFMRQSAIAFCAVAACLPGRLDLEEALPCRQRLVAALDLG